jgi:uncharacterized metal-binding protein
VEISEDQRSLILERLSVFERERTMADESKPPCCACSVAPKLIFACSGAADVGQIADLAARKLSAEGAGKMFCLAGIGGRVSGIVETTRAAAAVLAIDGCPLDCARKTLEEAGFAQFEHLRLSDIDMPKGATPATLERVNEVVAFGRMRLGGARGG